MCRGLWKKFNIFVKAHNSSTDESYYRIEGYKLLINAFLKLQFVTTNKNPSVQKSAEGFCFEKIYLYLAQQNGAKATFLDRFQTEIY